MNMVFPVPREINLSLGFNSKFVAVIAFVPILNPPIEPEANLALPVLCINANAVACVVATPSIETGTCISFADTVPNIVTSSATTPLLNKKFDAVTLPSAVTTNPDELISKFPCEPLIKLDEPPPTPVLREPKKNVFVFTSNIDGFVLNLK